MIRFVIKVGFFLGLIALVVPGAESREGEPEINPFALLYGAQAAVSDLSNFCERSPAACAAGADVAHFAGERVAEGFAIAYGFFGDAVAERRNPRPANEEAGVRAAEASPGDGLGSRPPRPAPAVRTDAVTTAAIAPPAALPRPPIPSDRALQSSRHDTTGHEVLRPEAGLEKSGRLPKAEDRPLPQATLRPHLSASVPVPVPAPRT